mmetsp:Transcript_14458/g.22304  ORF Transcript_14458/g.22304 Transcript_14458/m.22304 type:complete len:206 (-) Transcript_14458:793-1410(-)
MKTLSVIHFSALVLQHTIFYIIPSANGFTSSWLERGNFIPAGTRIRHDQYDARILFGSIADNDNIEEEDDECAGVNRVLSLPVESIKPGGLRLFLMLHLMGMQNTPQKGAWSVDQPTTEEYVVDLYFHDKTAMLMIRLTEEKVMIDRMGSTPSTAYVMQEAIVVDSILKELEQMTYEGDIKDEDRLILLKKEDAVAELREDLSFG